MTNPPYTDVQVRKALAELSPVSDFVRRHHEFRLSERTIYRQRADNPPPMRPYIKEALVKALVLDGKLTPAKPKARVVRKSSKAKADHPGAQLAVA